MYVIHCKIKNLTGTQSLSIGSIILQFQMLQRVASLPPNQIASGCRQTQLMHSCALCVTGEITIILKEYIGGNHSCPIYLSLSTVPIILSTSWMSCLGQE